MRVLNDFVGIDLTEDQLLPIARQLLPQLLVILGSPQVGYFSKERAVFAYLLAIHSLFNRLIHPRRAQEQSSSSANAL